MNSNNTEETLEKAISDRLNTCPLTKLERIDGPGWVTGSFINDALVVRVDEHCTMHTFEEKENGWRWNIHKQEWCESCAWKISDDQELRVLDWLEDHSCITPYEVAQRRSRVLHRLNSI